MSKSAQFENGLLRLIFNAVGVPAVADNAAAPTASLYLTLHTADPSAGTQATNEVAYPGYARVAVARSATGWTVNGGSAALAANTAFPPSTSAGPTATHYGVGTAASGAGLLLYSGLLSPAVALATGVQVVLTSGSTVITED